MHENLLGKYLALQEFCTCPQMYRKVDPSQEQHMAYEMNRNGRYYCDRLGAACGFRIVGLESDYLWNSNCRFDSLYYYACDQSIHISYAPQHGRNIWTFTDGGVPTRRGIEAWINYHG